MCVRVYDGGRNAGEMVREERAGRRACGAVLGGVLGRGEARLQGEPVQDSYEIAVHRAGALGDEEEHIVALALRVCVVVVAGGRDPPEAGAAVELRSSGPSDRWPRSFVPSVVTVRCSAVLPKAKRPPSACDAAPPQAREPLPRAGSTRWGVQHLNSVQVCGPLAPKRMMSGTCPSLMCA